MLLGALWVAVGFLGTHPLPDAFGPTESRRHPRVGPVAAVPGNGPEPVIPPAVEEVSLSRTGKAASLRSRAGSNPLFLLFLVYKNYLTHVDGSRCQHYPTCSAYGAQAVGKHNILGVFMAMDRLWASGSSSAVRQNRLVHGVGPAPRHYDPIEDTSFWFTYPLVAWLGPPLPQLDQALGRNEDSDPPVASLPRQPSLNSTGAHAPSPSQGP
jgi:putative component of membrane protein insertase Oxa1/YidC/SpoIIIJ protein YidD